MDRPFVSIIIPAKNAHRTLKKCLDSLLGLTYPAYEIIVINDGSTDNTEEILFSYQTIKKLSTCGVGPSVARNMGIKESRGEFIAFTDADCLVDSLWLEQLLQGFTDKKIAAVGGIQKSPSDDSPFGKIVYAFLAAAGPITDYMHPVTAIRSVAHNPSCNVMYRKSALEEMEGFLPCLWPGEDTELDYRLKKSGYLLKATPHAIVFHYRQSALWGYAKMVFRYGAAQGYLVGRYGFFRTIHLVTPLLLAILATLIVNPVIGTWIILTIGAWIVLMLCLKTKCNLPAILLFFPTFIFWNAGFMRGLLKRDGIA